MAENLLKTAKEFNVGISTVVDFLVSKGYSIESKPNAKVSDEMHQALSIEFKGSAEIKKNADQIQIGTSFKKAEEKPVVKPPIVKIEIPKIDVNAVITKPEVVAIIEDKPIEEIKPIKEVTPEPQIEAPVEAEKQELPGLKILGKIDLGSKKKAANETSKSKDDIKASKKEDNEVPKSDPISKAVEKEIKPSIQAAAEVSSVETPVIKNEAVVATEPSSTATVVDQEKVDPNEIDEFRAKTPQLAGLKILGKIDTDKFNVAPKGKKDVKPADNKGKAGSQQVNRPGQPGQQNKPQTPGTPVTPSTAAGSESDAAKRKRKRKKVTTDAPSTSGGAQGGGQRPYSPGQGGQNRPAPNKGPAKDEVKEVSQKEIDDKIKATMARLNNTGKNKRQKTRRDNREVKREKAELLNSEDGQAKLKLTEFVSVSELASLMDVPVANVIMTCMNLGVIVSINQRLDAEVIELLANEYGHEVEFTTVESVNEEEKEVIDLAEDLEPRAPIVTVMGHVDHGKTSLLDFIRSASVVRGEAGGITQHIGAYEVVVNGKKITFLDTPGHEAFTAMRARGAKITDVVIIVVAADDRIMPQTKEAISHATAAGVPIIFAINKIDKDGADPEKIKSELAGMNFLVEDWGGTYQSQDISAKKGTNIEFLLEKVLLQAEMLELTANPKRTATGAVIEASLDKGRGYVTKVLIQNGTLNIGDPIIAGSNSGKVKAMFNENGKKIKSAGPSTPVLILGLSGAPQAGEKFKETDTEQDARQIAAKRSQIEREQTNRASKRISLDEIGRRLALGNFKELNLIVKGDVDGSIEALTDSLIKLSVESIQVRVIHKAVGQISESDVLLASASDAIIIGFQVRPSVNARSLADKEGVQIKTYSIIYEALDEVKAAMEGLLEPTKEEKIIAQVQVREVYKISKIGTIAGCYVTEGKFGRNAHIRIIRAGIVIFPVKQGAHGEIDSLKRFKDDVKEVKFGLECGISVKGFNDIEVDDTIEAYEIIEIKQKLK
jgi:translation initiation factor IF-2